MSKFSCISKQTNENRNRRIRNSVGFTYVSVGLIEMAPKHDGTGDGNRKANDRNNGVSLELNS
jgi:hypothetical protein